MKLTYRGVEYHTNAPDLEVINTETIGCYRGIPCQRHHYSAAIGSAFVSTLMYRGVEYQTGGQPETAVAPQDLPQEVVTPAEIAVAPSLVVGQDFSLPIAPDLLTNVAELDKVHDTFIRKSLEHRLAVAREKGDDQLIQLLEAEEQYQAA